LVHNCYYCGQNEQDFIHSGRLGCEYCIRYLLRIENASYNYSQILRPFFGVPHPNQILRLQKVLEGISPSGFRIEDSRLLFRYRISRNRKGTLLAGRRVLFPFGEIQDFLRDEFPEIQYGGREGEVEFRVDPSWASIFQRNSHLKAFRFRLGDEDELRFEAIGELWKAGNPQPSPSMGSIYEKEFRSIVKWLSCPKRFAFHRRLGFVNSCPTNAGRGDRFSLVIDASQNFDTNLCREQKVWEEKGFSFAFLWEKKASGGDRKVFAGWKVSVKNFNFQRKFYFQHTLLPLIFKWSGLWRQCKTSSNR